MKARSPEKLDSPATSKTDSNETGDRGVIATQQSNNFLTLSHLRKQPEYPEQAKRLETTHERALDSKRTSERRRRNVSRNGERKHGNGMEWRVEWPMQGKQACSLHPETDKRAPNDKRSETFARNGSRMTKLEKKVSRHKTTQTLVWGYIFSNVASKLQQTQVTASTKPVAVYQAKQSM